VWVSRFVVRTEQHSKRATHRTADSFTSETVASPGVWCDTVNDGAAFKLPAPALVVGRIPVEEPPLMALGAGGEAATMERSRATELME